MVYLRLKTHRYQGQDEILARSIVAIDTGVPTFATAYLVNHAAKYGDGFNADRVFPLLLKLDAWTGLRAKAKHRGWIRHYQRKVDRLVIRFRSLVDDLHRRVAHDPVTSFDVILLPSFETRKMSFEIKAEDSDRIRSVNAWS